MKSNNPIKFKVSNLRKNISAVLVVDLNSIRKNYFFLKNRTSTSELGISIKANAYGLGYKKICQTLLECGCKTFFVATATEGLEILKVNKSLKVYVLNGFTEENSLLKLIKSGINIVINNIYQLEKLINISSKLNIKASCAIHIDTGMNRLGFDLAEAEKIISKDLKLINISLVMSHLSYSEAKESNMNNLQLKKFIQVKNKFKNIKSLKFSLSNSNGILLSKNFHFNLCRPGGLIYGLNLGKKKIKGIRNALVLLTKVIQIKLIKKGEYVGYGQKFKAKKNSRIATLGIGYSDGLPRNYKGNLSYKNYKFPIIGNISMDLCTIDISSCCGLQVNDWIEVFGNYISIDNFASNCNTISYEISSKIGARVERVYIDNTTEEN